MTDVQNVKGRTDEPDLRFVCNLTNRRAIFQVILPYLYPVVVLIVVVAVVAVI